MKCRACQATFTSDEKLERHVKKAHGGRASDGRLKWLALAALVALVVLFVAMRGEDAPPEGGEELRAFFQIDDDPYLGDPDAPITVIAFEAPKCSSCAFFHKATLPDIQAEHLDTGKAVFYYLQSSPGYAFDFDGGRAQDCVYLAGGNEAFWGFTGRIYDEQGAYAEANIGAWLDDAATTYDLDAEALHACYEEKRTSSNVSEDWNVRDGLRAFGTPRFYVFGPEGSYVEASSSDLGDVIQDLYLRQA